MSKRSSGKWRKWLIFSFILISFPLLIRNQIMKSIGNFLVVEDPKQRVDAIYVLSGNPYDRGMEAFKLYKEGWGPRVVCLGGETNTYLELYGINDLSSMATSKVLKQAGMPMNDIELLPMGTSTYEEFEAIVKHCQQHSYSKVMVVSSLFHTRRIHTYFRHRMYFSGVEMVLRGVQDSTFEVDAWWKKEQGLLFVNNECIKMMYYWLKY